MKPRDYIAIGLLLIIFYHITALFIIKLQGGEIENVDFNKEIIIYILGILSGYISNRKD